METDTNNKGAELKLSFDKSNNDTIQQECTNKDNKSSGADYKEFNCDREYRITENSNRVKPNTSEPFNDGLRKFNIIYIINFLICGFSFLAIKTTFNFFLVGGICGILSGWLIKTIISNYKIATMLGEDKLSRSRSSDTNNMVLKKVFRKNTIAILLVVLCIIIGIAKLIPYINRDNNITSKEISNKTDKLESKDITKTEDSNLNDIHDVSITTDKVTEDSLNTEKSVPQIKNINLMNAEELEAFLLDFPKDFFRQLILDVENNDGVSFEKYIEEYYGGTWYFTVNSNGRSLVSAYAAIPLSKGYCVFEYSVYIDNYDPNEGKKVLGFDLIRWSFYNPTIYMTDELVWEDEYGITTYDNAEFLKAETYNDIDFYNLIIEQWVSQVTSKNGISDNDYIISDSNSRFLVEEDLYNFTDEELRFTRNEIYARRGRKFNSIDLQKYFNDKEWYFPMYEPSYFDENYYDTFNKYEKYNLDFIKKYE